MNTLRSSIQQPPRGQPSVRGELFPIADDRVGFARTELVVMLVGLALFACVALPALANNRHRVERLVCVSNLGEIGKGYNLWASEHEDYYPFMLSRVDGGIRTPYNGLEANSWFQFSWVSNEIRSARVLACPSDTPKRPATDFSYNSGGLLHPNYRNNSISYFLAYPYYPNGHRVLSGDRNLKPTGLQGCSVFGYAASIAGAPFVDTRWQPTLHINTGNLLLRDGAVDEVNTSEMRQEFTIKWDDNGNHHLLMP